MITRHRFLFLVGIWIVLIPFLGFPTGYKTFFVIVSGLVVAAIAFSSARAKRLVTRRVRRAPAAIVSTTETSTPAETAPDVSTEHITDVDLPTT